MTVAGVVMAHPKRRPWAAELGESLGLPIVWDQVNDRHETGQRCLEAGLGSIATHWLVVQDDAIACGDLLPGLAQAVQVSGDRVVVLYVGNVRPRARRTLVEMQAARAAGASWLAMPGPWWGVGIVIPTAHLPALVEHYRASTATNYDRRIARWAADAGVECWYTLPSLVEHRHGEENPSLVPGRTSPTRKARWFLGADQSALDVDWTRLPLDRAALTPAPERKVTFHHVETGRVRVLPELSAAARRLGRHPHWEQVMA